MFNLFRKTKDPHERLIRLMQTLREEEIEEKKKMHDYRTLSNAIAKSLIRKVLEKKLSYNTLYSHLESLEKAYKAFLNKYRWNATYIVKEIEELRRYIGYNSRLPLFTIIQRIERLQRFDEKTLEKFSGLSNLDRALLIETAYLSGLISYEEALKLLKKELKPIEKVAKKLLEDIDKYLSAVQQTVEIAEAILEKDLKNGPEIIQDAFLNTMPTIERAASEIYKTVSEEKGVLRYYAPLMKDKTTNPQSINEIYDKLKRFIKKEVENEKALFEDLNLLKELILEDMKGHVALIKAIIEGYEMALRELSK